MRFKVMIDTFLGNEPMRIDLEISAESYMAAVNIFCDLLSNPLHDFKVFHEAHQSVILTKSMVLHSFITISHGDENNSNLDLTN